MRDCAKVDMRELLPDLLHDRLPAARRVEVESHVAGCADCRAELAILRRVLASAVAPRIDVARIAAAIPSYQTAPTWRRTATQLRVAAAVVLLIGSWAVLKSSAKPQSEDSGSPVAQTQFVAPPNVLAESIAPMPPVERPAVIPALAVGDSFHDVSDSELRALLDELVRLEAVTPAETEIELPSLGRSGA